MSDDLTTQVGGEALPAELPTETQEPVSRRDSIAAQFDRSRDEQGRFAPEQKAESTEAAPVTPEPEKPARKYPSSWRKEIEPIYRKAESDPELVKLIEEAERREADFHKGIEGYKSKAQFAETMERAIAPFMPTIESLGASPDRAVTELLQADAVLRHGSQEQKQAALYQLAQSYGIPINGEMPQIDPTVAALMQKIQQLETGFSQFGHQQQQATQTQINQEIESFASAHEHFDSVRETMAALLSSGVASGLDDAYNKAVKLDDGLYQAQLAKQREAEERTKREQAAKAAQDARLRAVSVRGAPVGQAQTSPKDRRGMIEAAFGRNRV